MGWRDEAIRLIFLIADAPPHLDYPQDKDYATEMMRAQEKGIKVFSVGLQRAGPAGGIHPSTDSPADHGEIPVHPVPHGTGRRLGNTP